MTNKFTLPFIKKEQVAKDTFSFFFDRSKFEFEYVPGQYIRMILPNDHPDDRGTSRFFTVASSPHLTDHIMITTKVIQSTFKYSLHDLTPGTEIQFYGPLGSFVLDVNEKAQHIYLAGGIGLTPYHSMLTYSAEKNLEIPQTLFVSFSTREEMVFYDELTHLKEKNKFLNAIYTISHPENSDGWSGETGRVSEAMIRKYVSLTGKEIYYISGPPAMVDATQGMVSKMGIDEEHIRIEHFSGY